MSSLGFFCSFIEMGFPTLRHLRDGSLLNIATSEESPDWITASQQTDDYVSFKVVINGKRVLALLDTGASITLIDTHLAGQLGLIRYGSGKVAGNVALCKLDLAGNVSMQIQHHTIHLPRVGVLELSTTFARNGVNVGPILGNDALSSGMLILDLSHGRIAFQVGQSFKTMSGDRWLPMQRGRRGELIVPVSIGDEQSSQAIVDTGSSNPIMISINFPGLAKALAGKPMSSAAIAGVDGNNVTQTASLDLVSLGSARFSDVPAESLTGKEVE